MNSHSEPTSLDPRLISDIPSVTTAKILFDGLCRMTEQGATPSLALKIEVSEDKKCYSFHLKKSLWSNGEPITAHDFEYSWKSILDPNFPAQYAHQLFILKNGALAKMGAVPTSGVGVRALADDLLVVELEHPSNYFLELTAFPLCYPVNRQTDENNPEWANCDGKSFVCSGPFNLIQWRKGADVVVQKNPLYWESEVVQLDQITLSFIEDEHTELNMYENGELDWAGSPNSSIPPEALPELQQRANTELFVLPIAGTYCYKFNTKVAPFHSQKIRQAFAYAIDRKILIDNILQAHQIAAQALIPPCVVANHQDLPNAKGLAEAKALFEQACTEEGWNQESFPPVTLIFSRSEKHHKMAQAVQQQWNEAFGIKVALQSYEWNTFVQKLNQRDYQVGGRGWVSDLSDPLALLEIYKQTNDAPSGGGNDTHWHNKSFARLLEEAKRCPDPTRRTLLLNEAETILMEQMPIAPLYHSTACYLKKSYVKGVYLSKLCDLDFKYAYFDD